MVPINIIAILFCSSVMLGPYFILIRCTNTPLSSSMVIRNLAASKLLQNVTYFFTVHVHTGPAIHEKGGRICSTAKASKNLQVQVPNMFTKSAKFVF